MRLQNYEIGLHVRTHFELQKLQYITDILCGSVTSGNRIMLSSIYCCLSMSMAINISYGLRLFVIKCVTMSCL